MDGSSSASDDRGLFHLRARSDGQDADIQDDAEEPARPADLAPQALSVDEPAAEVTDAGAPAEAGRLRAFWRRATETRRRRIAWAVAGLVAVAAVVTAVVLVSAPPLPDVTLLRTADEADDQILRLVREGVPWMEIDGSTLRGYEPYRGLELWSGENAYDSLCLVAVQRVKELVSEAGCAPRPADLFIDVSSFGDEWDGHPGDGIVRFLLRGDAVDAYISFRPEAG